MKREGWIGEFPEDEIVHDFGPRKGKDEAFESLYDELYAIKMKHHRRDKFKWLDDSSAHARKVQSKFGQSYQNNAFYHLLIGSSQPAGTDFTFVDFPDEYSVERFIRDYEMTD